MQHIKQKVRISPQEAARERGFADVRDSALHNKLLCPVLAQRVVAGGRNCGFMLYHAVPCTVTARIPLREGALLDQEAVGHEIFVDHYLVAHFFNGVHQGYMPS